MIQNIDYRYIFTALPFPCLLLKPENGKFFIVDSNEHFFKLTGTNGRDVEGYIDVSSFIQILKVDLSGGKLLMESLQQLYVSKERVVVRNLKHRSDESNCSPNYLSIEFVPAKNPNDKLEYVVLTVKNVTERVLQEELMRSQEQYEHFISESKDGLYSLDLMGNFTSVNKYLAQIAEIPQEEMVGMNFLPFCDPENRDQILKYFQKALSGDTVTFEGNFMSLNSNTVLLEITLIPIRTQNSISGLYGIAKDITGQRKTEKIAVEKKKFLEVSASFISTLLKNDLNNKDLQHAFGMVGNAVDVDRMYYFEARQKEGLQETFISQKIEWTSKNATPQKDNPEMQELPISKVKEIIGALDKNMPFIANFSKLSEGGLKNIFIEQEIKSMLLLPIFLKQRLCGFIGFDDCRKERVWKKDEISFLESLAHSLSTAWEKAAAESALRQREEELKRSEQKFKALVQEGSDLLAIMDTSGNFKFVSDTTTSILGITPDELKQRNAFELVHEEDKERVNNEFQDLRIKKRIKMSPYRFLDAKGDFRWLETTATNLKKDPAVEGIVTNSRDITTIITQAEEIRNINERYEIAAAATQDIIYDWNLETDEVVRFLKGIDELFGYSAEEVQKRNFWKENIHPDEIGGLKKELADALADSSRNFLKTSYRFRRSNGTYAHIVDRGYIIRNKKGKAIRHIGASSDISDLKNNEEALKAANDRFKMAMKATNEMIWEWKYPSDKIIRSKNFTSVYGYESNQKTALHSFWVSKIITEDRERVKTSLKEAIANKVQKKWKEEYCFVKASGEVAHVLDRGFIRRDSEGNVVRLVGAVLDVTESRRLLKKIKEQNQTLKEIAWEQSHVVRAPVARIKGLLQLFELEAFDEINEEEVLNHIKGSADELDDIIREIVKKTEKIGDYRSE